MAPLPTSFPNNSEEIEIDRLLLELGIELPAVESIAHTPLPAGVDSGSPTSNDEAESRQDEEEAVFFSLPLPLVRMISWPPETES